MESMWLPFFNELNDITGGQRRWELEMSKLRLELEKKWSRYEGYIDRLERRAGSRFNPNEDGKFLSIHLSPQRQLITL